MTVVVDLLRGPVTRTLRAPYGDVSVTVRRLRSPEWDQAREKAQTILRDDAALLNLLVEHDLLPIGGVKAWKRMKDEDPIAYAGYLAGIGMWLAAVECALVGLVGWKGINDTAGQPAALTREVLEVLLLDEALSDQIMAVITEAARILVVEGKPSGALPSGSSEPVGTA